MGQGVLKRTCKKYTEKPEINNTTPSRVDLTSNDLRVTNSYVIVLASTDCNTHQPTAIIVSQLCRPKVASLGIP